LILFQTSGRISLTGHQFTDVDSHFVSAVLQVVVGGAPVLLARILVQGS
jgi:hypothetical protein